RRRSSVASDIDLPIGGEGSSLDYSRSTGSSPEASLGRRTLIHGERLAVEASARVVAFAADLLHQRAEWRLVAAQLVDGELERVLRLPAKLGSRPLIHVHPIDGVEEPPASGSICLLEVDVASHDPGRIRAEKRQVVLGEGGSRAQ